MGLLPGKYSETNPFETKSDEYDHWYDTHASLYEKELEFIRPFVRDEEGRILEIGCGSGRFASPLALSIGVEPSGPLSQMAYQRGVPVIQAIGEYLPFQDNVMIQIFLITVIGFLASPTDVLKEIRRTLHSSGSVIIVDIDRESELGQKYQRTIKSSTFLSHARLYSPQEICSLLQEHGYRISTIRRGEGLFGISGGVIG